MLIAQYFLCRNTAGLHLVRQNLAIETLVWSMYLKLDAMRVSLDYSLLFACSETDCFAERGLHFGG